MPGWLVYVVVWVIGCGNLMKAIHNIYKQHTGRCMSQGDKAVRGQIEVALAFVGATIPITVTS